MITTRASRDYTPIALRSLFAHTPDEQLNHVVLVDNDGDFTLPADLPAERLTIVRHAAPQGFARNANLLLSRAREVGADLYLLNNDLVFTPGWLEPLLADRRALLSPVSNAQAAYRSGGLATQPVMSLDEYVGHEAELETIARQHRAARSGYETAGAVTFFCIKIARAVYEAVGEFDERFGKGGAEDRDYTIRAWIAGIPTEFAAGSYVLHFQGRSTWRGTETLAERKARDAQYLQAFEAKWGPALTYAFLREEFNLFRTDARLARWIERGEFTPVVRHLRSHRALDPFVARQRSARFAAVCCVYEDDSWLAPTVESVYEVCDSIWFLVGDRPWHGEPGDQSALLATIAALPDPAGKFRVVRGSWPDEATQRNEGLRLLAEAGIEYCLVLDADEVHDPEQLAAAMTLVRNTPAADYWTCRCFTYWKSAQYRIDPPEAIPFTLFVRVGAARFVENRSCLGPRRGTIEPSMLMMHHMSYARTDAQILRKITTFGHAKDVVPGWFDNVWRRWDSDHSIRNLNPCWPGAYQRAIEQPAAQLPPALQRHACPLSASV
jgi:GT2 family glycosyltransferase